MRCIDANIKYLELIRADLSKHSDCKITPRLVTSSQPPNSSSANAAQTPISESCVPTSKHTHENTRTEGATFKDDSTPVNVSPCTTTRLTENLRPSFTALCSLPNTCDKQSSHFSFIETIKAEPNGNDVILQTDPLELVSCSYVNGINIELKPRSGNISDNQTGNRIKKNPKFKCSICSKIFQSKHTLTKHLRYHAHVSRFTCTLCDLRCSSSQSLQNHLGLKHTKNNNFKSTLYKTGRQYKLRNDLLIHVSKIHCRMDGVGSTAGDINRTMLQSEQVNIFKSENIAERAPVADSSLTRMFSVPNNTCVVCNETFIEKRDLESHVEIHSIVDGKNPTGETHHDNNDDTNLCSFCGKTFSTKKLLYQHVRLTHTSLKKHKCMFCEKSYKRNSVLQNHITAVHEKRKFQCTLCGSLLSSANSFHSHMKKHENGNREPTVKCPVCPKLFKHKNNVERHMRSHTGETPYKCSYCPREFTLRWNLIQHERLHRGEKRYKCDKCGKAFTHNVSRKNHMKYHMDD